MFVTHVVMPGLAMDGFADGFSITFEHACPSRHTWCFPSSWTINKTFQFVSPARLFIVIMDNTYRIEMLIGHDNI